jgi:lysyl-tRNA synthetase class 2
MEGRTTEGPARAVRLLRTTAEDRIMIGRVLESFDQLEVSHRAVEVAGRIKEIRDHGAVRFYTIADSTGSIQIIDQSKRQSSGEIAGLNRWDIVSAVGHVGRSRNGTQSVILDHLEVLVPCERPLLPGRIDDPEKRAKQRHLDLLTNADSTVTFTRVSKTLAELRRFLGTEGFLEFETQILKGQYDGGTSRPFVTFHDALKRDFFLRVTSEMQLKQLLIGGFDNVFEIGKSFRNEGIGNMSYPEFTLLEAYSTFRNYRYVMNLVERMVRQTALSVTGSDTVTFDGSQVQLGRPWERITFRDAGARFAGVDIREIAGSQEAVKKVAEKFELGEAEGYDAVMSKLLDKVIRPNLVQPTFVTELPESMSPFARPIAKDPFYAERAWGYAGGLDLCDIFSDENNPATVRRKFAEEDRKAYGKVGYSHVHEDFIDGLTYGLPPSSGVGFSVNRLLMLLTDKQNIRDVIPFQHV